MQAPLTCFKPKSGQTQYSSIHIVTCNVIQYGTSQIIGVFILKSVQFHMSTFRGLTELATVMLLLLFFIAEEFLQEHHQVLVTRLFPIVREIADTRARNRDELEGLYNL